MDNYKAILNMNEASMEAFLDQVYLAGLNTGMYAAGLPDDSEEQCDLLDRNPFDREWLGSDAEEATLSMAAEDGEAYYLNALTAAIFLCAGIDPEEVGD